MANATCIILCPGQGAQHVGMGQAWADCSEAAAHVFAEADAALDEELSGVCFDGPDDQINRTDIAQAAIYVTSVACCRALEERGQLTEPTAAAGLSLGEYTALHLAGALDFIDGLRLVRQRGRFMQEAAEATESGMVALMGADEPQAEELCAQAAQNEVLVPANFNCPGQVVISGSTAACGRAEQLAQEMGLRATPLTVAGAFHSPLMQPAAERMAEALEQTTIEVPRLPVMCNVTGQPHDDDADMIRRRLVEQITRPVRWQHNVQWLLDHEHTSGVRFIEPAPGKVLSGLMRRIDRKTKVENFAEPDD